MKEYTLIENSDNKLILFLDSEDCDYYTDVYIKLIFDGNSIVLFKDNLLALKNILGQYENDISGLDEKIDEEKIGLLLNEYYRCIYVEQMMEKIILNNQGQWIGEKYCLFTSQNNATWLYEYEGDFILKVTPIFKGFEEDDFMDKYTEFILNYKDIKTCTIDKIQFEKMKEIILELYYDFFDF